MMERKITDETIQLFYQYLIQEEKSAATVEKYLRDVRAFSVYAGNVNVTKVLMMSYKKYLQVKEPWTKGRD